MTDLDLLVVGDCNPDLVLSGGDLVPRFSQVEQLVDNAELVIGGSAEHRRIRSTSWVAPVGSAPS